MIVRRWLRIRHTTMHTTQTCIVMFMCTCRRNIQSTEYALPHRSAAAAARTAARQTTQITVDSVSHPTSRHYQRSPSGLNLSTPSLTSQFFQCDTHTLVGCTAIARRQLPTKFTQVHTATSRWPGRNAREGWAEGQQALMTPPQLSSEDGEAAALNRLARRRVGRGARVGDRAVEDESWLGGLE